MSEVEQDVTGDAVEVSEAMVSAKASELAEPGEPGEPAADGRADADSVEGIDGVGADAGDSVHGVAAQPEGDRQSDGAGASADDEAGVAALAGGRSGSRSASRVALLEREGEVAADFLERLLDIADLDGDIDVDIDGDRAAVSIVDSDEGRVPRRLVGPDGKVLDALQELTRLAVQTATGERSRLMLDVAGFRADRRAALVTLARESIAQVRTSGVAVALANMTAFERKVVHDEVTAAGLVSESEGVEPHRHIVISPA